MLVFDAKKSLIRLGMLNLMQMQNLKQKNPYYPMLG
jgi:hypothetical protein